MDRSEPAREGNAAYMKMQRDIYYQAVHFLSGTLPKPPREHNEDFARRCRVAVAQVASLLPVNADETNLAVHCVAASAQAEECLRCVVEEAEDPATIARLQKQAASMMRESRGSRSMLLRVQAVRHKREADENTCRQDEWAQHCAFGMMTDALEERLERWSSVLKQAAAVAEKARAAAARPPQGASVDQDNIPGVASVAQAGAGGGSYGNADVDDEFDIGTDADAGTDTDDAGTDTDLDRGADDFDLANMPSNAEMLQLLESLPTADGLDPQVMERLESIVNGTSRKPASG